MFLSGNSSSYSIINLYVYVHVILSCKRTSYLCLDVYDWVGYQFKTCHKLSLIIGCVNTVYGICSDQLLDAFLMLVKDVSVNSYVVMIDACRSNVPVGGSMVCDHAHIACISSYMCWCASGRECAHECAGDLEYTRM